MFRRFDQGAFPRLGRGLSLAVLAVVSLSGTVQAQAPAKPVPDAQVQANVLKALAGAPDLASQSITTTTEFGVVTLSGSVTTEALRTQAENIVSRTMGVKKVIDEMTLSPQGAATPASGSEYGTAVPQEQAPTAQGSPESDNTGAMPSQSSSSAAGPSYGPGAPEYRQPYSAQPASPQGYPQTANGQQPAYPSSRYPQQGYPQQGYPQQRAYDGPPQSYGGQEAGQVVTIPSGSLIRIRISETLDSGRTQPGTKFDGIVVNDVVAEGAIAIPRGAAVQGTVIDAKKSGVLAGRGEISLQLTHVTLGGQSFPIVSDVWDHHGGDKTIETVNKTAIGGGIGALFGAAAGGGEGAAIGAGIGGALGLGSSAASGNGQVYIPAEGMLTFHITQPSAVTTVSQQEMDRLAQGVPGTATQTLQRRRFPAPYYGPAYYRPYYPYPY